MGTIVAPDIDFGSLEQRGRQLGLDLGDLAVIVGVDPSTLWRWRQREAPPRRALVVSRLVQITELFDLLRRLFDGPDLARTWLRDARPASLGGTETPLAVLRAGRIDRILGLLHTLAVGG